MDLSCYLQRRVFRRRFDGASAIVTPWMTLWALLLGPLYFWKKGARIEALILTVVGLPLIVTGDVPSLGATVVSDLSTILWIGAVIFAPLLIAASLRRQGWTEMSAADAGHTDSALFPLN